MSRATDHMMDQLHLITAKKLADIIENGMEIPNKEGEGTIRVPAPAAYIAAAIKFLKDNGITSEPDADRFKNLRKSVEEIPVFDEDEAFDHAMMN